MKRLEELQTLEGHSDRVWSVAWSPSGELLASCSGDKTVRIWSKQRDTQNWHCVAILEDTHNRTIRSCDWSPDGRHLATASFDATVAIWELQGIMWEQVATLEGHENEVKGCAWSPDGSLLATCGRDKSVWIWESLPGNEFECADVKTGHSGDVKALAWHPRGEALVSASYDDTIKVWVSDMDEWLCAQTLEGPGIGHTSTVWGLSFSPSGDLMASCSDDLTLKIWRCSFSGREPNWKLLTTLSGYHSRTIYSMHWGLGDHLATGDGSNSIKVFERVQEGGREEGLHGLDLPTFSLACCVEGAHSLDVNCVRWHPKDTTLLASAADDQTIKLWRLV